MSRRRETPPATLLAFWAHEAAAWRDLSALWRGLPEAAYLAPGACGPEWTLKDVWNHLAAWMDATRAVLPALLANQPLPRGAYHPATFNPAHHAADSARSLAASRRRLNRARRALLRLVAALPPGPVLDTKARPGRWLKFATYGHYAEHRPALAAFAARHRK
jgi:hypothetical protein